MIRYSGKFLLRLIGAACILVLIGVGVAPPVFAQDIQYDVPVIVTLSPGQSITRTFAIQAGDNAEIILTPLAQYTFTAVLIDPNQLTTPLTPGADGSIRTVIETAPAAGVYALVLQATQGSGELLIRVNRVEGGPTPLPIGESAVLVETSELQFALIPPPALGPTVLLISPSSDLGAVATIPGFTILNAVTGEVVLSVSGGLLPSVAISLPAQQTFTLILTPGAAPQPLLISWTEGSAGVAPPEAEELIPTPVAVNTCEMTFSGSVNIRSGPGLQHPIIGQGQAGMVLPVTGHNGNFNWYQVIYNGQYNWVSGTVAATILQGDCTNLPVASTTTSPTATATSGASPTSTLTATIGPSPTPTHTPTSTYTATAGPSPTPTHTPPVTATYTPTATTPPPTATYTPTLQPPTATYTPTYTPTVAVPTAPPDANFNSPLNIPLDSTASTTDFVSYPGGDTEDRTRWDITGMNSNTALSGGRARLILTVSCFGTGTQNIQFFTGGQTYSCGQTIVDREVTFDSRTGQVTITAVGGTNTYVQWVVTGTATRVN